MKWASMSLCMAMLTVLLVQGALAQGLPDVPAPCTSTTCPPGLIRAEFEYANCSGEVTFYPMAIEPDTCFVEYDQYRLYEVGAEALVYTRFSPNAINCDRSAVNVSYELEATKFGACIPNEIGMPRRRSNAMYPSAFMILRNINDSYTSPQNFANDPAPEWNPGSGYCDGLNDCYLSPGVPSPLWQSSYPTVCGGDDGSSYFTGYSPDVCQNYFNTSYYRSGCFAEHGNFDAYFSDADCTQPILVLAHFSVCAENSTSTTIYCTATPVAIPQFPPSPSAPSSTPSSTPSAPVSSTPSTPSTPSSSASQSPAPTLLFYVALLLLALFSAFF